MGFFLDLMSLVFSPFARLSDNGYPIHSNHWPPELAKEWSKVCVLFLLFCIWCLAVSVTLWSNLFKKRDTVQIILYTSTLTWLLVSSWMDKFALLICECNSDGEEMKEDPLSICIAFREHMKSENYQGGTCRNLQWYQM